MITESTWQEFADSGLFWWTNRSLHLFGWALVREVEEDGTIIRIYPARCTFRGFSEDVETNGFKKLTTHIATNVNDLVKAVEE